MWIKTCKGKNIRTIHRIHIINETTVTPLKCNFLIVFKRELMQQFLS